jgi:hypothetical protein
MAGKNLYLAVDNNPIVRASIHRQALLVHVTKRVGDVEFSDWVYYSKFSKAVH